MRIFRVEKFFCWRWCSSPSPPNIQHLIFIYFYLIFLAFLLYYPDGRTHDHGTGFRVFPDNLDMCFQNRENVM
jgi:hypothetical protein